MNRLILLLNLLVVSSHAVATDFTLRKGEELHIACTSEEQPVVKTAVGMFASDFVAVFSGSTEVGTEGKIIVGTVGSRLLNGVDVSSIRGLHEAFLLEVNRHGQLVVAGSDMRGTAYGILQLSRLIGVSPWVWWADATPTPRDSFMLRQGYHDSQKPSVPYRGIFINDEDDGFRPWATETHEPSAGGRIGPKTHARVFELLLRLRANTFWPAMHAQSYPFFLTKGNRETAERYGILIGTSHCEPMLTNVNGEWKLRLKGAYNYFANRANVLRFWETRVKETRKTGGIYTLGMRGEHDGAMWGTHSTVEYKEALARVIADQRLMLRRHGLLGAPQVFIPYKEVLDVYREGLQVPDDVTLLWCDDNYGYLTHFPTPDERKRSGGNGVYYHISYWGRPQAYIWTGTTPPQLIFQQMGKAWEQGMRQMWIVNVGDIKPLEYPMEFFLDMAWDIGGMQRLGVRGHQTRFLEREFGRPAASLLLPAMQEYYRLMYIHKPEFMGNTQIEDPDPASKTVKDLPWDEVTVRGRIANYQGLEAVVDQAAHLIAPQKQDAYFQLVAYPLKAAKALNDKMLYAQLARHGLDDWRKSDEAHDAIGTLASRYNKGKWRGMISAYPQYQVYFHPLRHDTAREAMPVADRPLYSWNATECDEGTPAPCELLGYEGKAAEISKDTELAFSFDAVEADILIIEVSLLPSFPVTGSELKFAISLDGDAREAAYQTEGRTPEWKQNVLWNRSVRRFRMPLAPGERHGLRFRALTEGVVLDRIAVYADMLSTPR